MSSHWKVLICTIPGWSGTARLRSFQPSWIRKHLHASRLLLPPVSSRTKVWLVYTVLCTQVSVQPGWTRNGLLKRNMQQRRAQAVMWPLFMPTLTPRLTESLKFDASWSHARFQLSHTTAMRDSNCLTQPGPMWDENPCISLSNSRIDIKNIIQPSIPCMTSHISLALFLQQQSAVQQYNRDLGHDILVWITHIYAGLLQK